MKRHCHLLAAVACMFATILSLTTGCGGNEESPEEPVEPEIVTPDKPDTPAEKDKDEENGPDVDIVTPDQWVATDELGRTMPEDAPESRENRSVLMFYWTWHQTSQCNYPSVVNVTQVLKEHPEAINDYYHKAWGKDGQPYFWGQPLFGYYRTTDKWVLRKHAELLADAGVDAVFFDCTNGSLIWEESTEALMEVWSQAQKDGVNVPKISFLLPFSASDNSLTSLRNLFKNIYAGYRYENLWFRVNGKPCLMAYASNLGNSSTDNAIRSFFTFRPGQPDYVSGGSGEQWGWLECYPQHGYNGREEMPVGVAQNACDASGGHCYAFNAPGAYGRSYTRSNGSFDSSEGAYVKGLNFQEQWDRALKYDPKHIFVTGWNEWIAGKYHEWPEGGQKPVAFPDEFNSEYSRDIEPNAEWGDYGDIYYYQLAQNVRRYKGVGKRPRVSAEKTVNIGAFEGWKDVSPDFKHYRGNTMHRAHLQHSQSGIYYTNTTGRNDIVDARVARDADYVYFYVKTDEDMTVPSDPGWMRLFINIDRNMATGWKGYDFCLNYKNPENTTTGILSKCTGPDWKWDDAGTFEYSVSGNKMEIKVAKSALGVEGKLNFEFKWSDNMQEEGNILDFYVNGDVAPGGRFNFVYSEP